MIMDVAFLLSSTVMENLTVWQQIVLMKLIVLVCKFMYYCFCSFSTNKNVMYINIYPSIKYCNWLLLKNIWYFIWNLTSSTNIYCKTSIFVLFVCNLYMSMCGCRYVYDCSAVFWNSLKIMDFIFIYFKSAFPLYVFFSHFFRIF